MTQENEPQQPFVSRLVKAMRDNYAAFMSEHHRRWDALEKIRDGSYTNEYKHNPWKTRYRSPNGIVQLEHQKAISLQRLPVPRAISDSEEETVAGLPDIANAAIDQVGAAIDYNRLCDGMMDDTHVYGPAVVKILVKPNKDLDVRLVSLRNIYPHPLAESLADCEALVEDITLPLSEAWRRWPDKKKELTKAAALGSVGMGLDAKGSHLYETPNDYDEAGKAAFADMQQSLTVPVRLYEAWFRTDESVEMLEEFYEPTGQTYADGTPKTRRDIKRKKVKKYPGGRHVITTSEGDVVIDEKNYDPDGRFPYVMVGCYWRPHKFWPKGDLEFMAPTIILLDEMVSAMADAAKHLAYPSFLFDPRAGVDRSMLIYRPGQWTPMSNPNMNFREIQPAPMHDSVLNLIPLLSSNLKLGSGTPDEHRGFRPRGDVTGESIKAMATLASITPGLKHSNFERAMSELFQRLFEYMKKYWTRTRELVVNPQANDITWRRIQSDPQDADRPGAGPNPATRKVLYWEPEKMKDSHIRIIVEPGSGIPADPEVEYQGLLSLAQMLAAFYESPGLAKASEVIPKSYIISQSPIRSKAMLMQRAYQQEFQEAREKGAMEGMQEAMKSMSPEELQAYIYQQGTGGGPRA